jgi:hypothetical protein
MIMLGRGDMHWKGLSLYLGTKKQDVTVLPDPLYPKMFRLRRPDGSMSDLANLARIKDAAMVIVAAIANSATKVATRKPVD